MKTKPIFQPVIGLEVHIELKTKSKMFCGCLANHFGRPANTQTCPVCLGLPGALPFANKQAISWTVASGLALDCQIPLFTKFDRKNYFYPDLAKGFQISQYDKPLCQNGLLGQVRIRRVHLEEDTAKMIHREKETLIDFNRSGVPLMEVVTEPDFHTANEAKDFLKKLQLIVRFLGISDCDMEKGSMRLEANVSLRKKGQVLPDYKVEIKNLNSFRFVQKAVDYEIKRQTKLLKADKKPVQETRGWDANRQITYPQRTKEAAHDYRYFPEPDLPPLKWTEKQIRNIKSQLPELPNKRQERFITKFGLSDYQAQILTSDLGKADYFEKTVKIRGQITIKDIVNAIINKRVEITKASPEKLIKILLLKQTKLKIDKTKLKKIIKQVIAKNPKAVKDYQKGKKNAVEFLLGQVMAAAKGQAKPNQARQLIIQTLI